MPSISSHINTLITNIRTGSGLSSRVTRGSMLLGIGGGVEHGCRFLRNILLTRLIAPEDFGLVAIVSAVNGIYESVTQIGTNEAIIQNPRGSQEEFLNSAWWISFVRGCFLYLLAFFLAPGVAYFYEKSELTPLMRTAMLTVIFTNALSPRCYADLKQLKYVKWVTVYNGGGMIGVATAISLGFLFHNAWALILGIVVEAAARCLISFIANPFCPSFHFEKETLQILFRFSRGMLGIPMLTYIYNNLDLFFVGKLFSIADAGMYNLASNLSFAPLLLLTTINVPLLMPIISSFQDNKEKLSEVFSASFIIIAMIFFPLLIIMSFFSPEILTYVYGRPYAAVSTPFAFFCFNISVSVPGILCSGLFIATGRLEINRKVQIIRLLLFILFLFPLIFLSGLSGAAAARFFSSLIWLGYNIYLVKQIINFSDMLYMIPLCSGFGLWLLIIGTKYFFFV